MISTALITESRLAVDINHSLLFPGFQVSFISFCASCNFKHHSYRSVHHAISSMLSEYTKDDIENLLPSLRSISGYQYFPVCFGALPRLPSKYFRILSLNATIPIAAQTGANNNTAPTISPTPLQVPPHNRHMTPAA